MAGRAVEGGDHAHAVPEAAVAPGVAVESPGPVTEPDEDLLPAVMVLLLESCCCWAAMCGGISLELIEGLMPSSEEIEKI